jgi:subtilisin family serine protease
MFKKSLLFTMLATTSLGALSFVNGGSNVSVFAQESQNATNSVTIAENTVPGEFLVKLKPGIDSDKEVEKLKNNFEVQTEAIKMDQGSYLKIELPKVKEEVSTLVEESKKIENKDEKIKKCEEANKKTTSSVEKISSILEDEYVVPNYKIVSDSIPRDELFRFQTNLNNPTNRDINAPEAWNITKGNPNTGIIVMGDSFNPNVSELRANFRGFIGSNPPSWNATIVASIAAGDDNGTGMVGVCPNCGVYSASVTSTTGFLRSLQTTNFRQFGRIVNMSFTFPQFIYAQERNRLDSQAFINDVQVSINNQTRRNGIIFVASAGNCAFGCDFDGNGSFDREEINPIYKLPASLNNVISVGSVNSDDRKSSFSEFRNDIDIMAPGNQVLAQNNLGGFERVSGTSFSAPTVSGVIGLMLSINPNLTPAQVEANLKASARNINTLNPQFVGRIGAGRVDAFQAVVRARNLINTPPRINRNQISVLGSATNANVRLRAFDANGIRRINVQIFEGGTRLRNCSFPFNANNVLTPNCNFRTATRNNKRLVVTVTDGQGASEVFNYVIAHVGNGYRVQ